jgi:NAD(P)-dependent dehydrogenase (short-subunit alcohol dehydrogenase family)
MNGDELAGRVAWVTGGASGMGAATVELLRARRATVGVFDVKGLEGAPGDHNLLCDVADPVAVVRATEAMASAIGPADILVSSAGIFEVHALGKTSDEVWARVVGVNLTGVFNMTRAVFTGMCDRGWGRIVSIASASAYRVGMGLTAYGASKAGVVALMKGTALEGAAHGVTANSIAPGIVDTPMIRKYFPTDERMQRAASDSPVANPQQAVIQPADVASAVVFLCLPESHRITGQTLHVNGGAITVS